MEDLVRTALRPRPRLVVPAGDEERIRRAIASDADLAAADAAIRSRSDAILAAPVAERRLHGRRLLGVSREVLRRVLYLSYCHRMTRDRRYAERAAREMLAVASFSDWNPSHFLDVAEMTAALAFGLDWLDDALPADTRAAVRDAIVGLGIGPSFDGTHFWIASEHNWNQVCHGGLVLGALAVADERPDLAARVIGRAVENLPHAMREYAPDGAYPEGPGYWDYGTTFNALLIAALESALGTDLGIAASPGFVASATYRLHMVGPTGRSFNYSDCGERAGISTCMAFFAARTGNPDLLLHERRSLAGARSDGREPELDRFAPLFVAWAPPGDSVRAPDELCWRGRGTTPVAVQRSSWTSDAAFVAIKGGSPGTNHAHMDAGSFVLDLDGVRWAADLGAQDYHSLESIGMGIWVRAQESDRWRVFRYTNHAHNTLVVDGRPQLVTGRAELVAPPPGAAPGRAVVDMTGVYAGALASARRGATLLAGRRIVIRDEVRALDRASSVRWGMVTPAEVAIEGPGRALLRCDGRSLRVEVLEPAGVALRVLATDPPPAAHDAPNPGTRILAFEVALAPGAAGAITVAFVPGGGEPVRAEDVRALDEW